MVTIAETPISLTPEDIYTFPGENETTRCHIGLSADQMAVISQAGLGMCQLLCHAKEIRITDLGPDYVVKKDEESPFPIKPDDPPACTRPYTVKIRGKTSKNGSVNIVIHSEQNPEVLKELPCGLGQLIITAIATEQK
ncbi:MAG: hypothetical protein HYW86_04825 [Candidatus Roizmanbacteria bacterium]|nr:MAG: hypothetical protein HYW86_04825 [Candidatus Roizmanbacteria bacterium]